MANILYISSLIVVIFVTDISCNDAKRSITDGVQTEVNVNLSEDLLRGLAKIPKKMDKQAEQLQNLTEIVAKMAHVVENLLQRQLTILSERLPIPSSPMTSPTTTLPTTTLPPMPSTSPQDCQDVADYKYHKSGVYTITPDEQGPIDVYCEIDDQRNGWVVIQKRFDGSVDFQLGWEQYEVGFGNVEGEHWAGLKLMNRLTTSSNWQLSINITDHQGRTAYAQYDSFSVGAGSGYSGYTLHVSGFSGSTGVGDALMHQNGEQFSTSDRYNAGNTHITIYGGWWYDSCCYFVNFNALYGMPSECCKNIAWYTWHDGFVSLTQTQMKIRRIN